MSSQSARLVPSPAFISHKRAKNREKEKKATTNIEAGEWRPRTGSSPCCCFQLATFRIASGNKFTHGSGRELIKSYRSSFCARVCVYLAPFVRPGLGHQSQSPVSGRSVTRGSGAIPGHIINRRAKCETCVCLASSHLATLSVSFWPSLAHLLPLTYSLCQDRITGGSFFIIRLFSGKLHFVTFVRLCGS